METISSVLEMICEQNSVNSSLKELVFFHFFPYLERESIDSLSISEFEALCKFSILICSRLNQVQSLNFSQLFSKEFVTWDRYSVHFNKFLSVFPLPSKLVDEISQLIQSVQVGKTLFCKLSSIWDSLGIEGNPEYINQVMQGSWLLYITARSIMLKKTNSLDDCLFLMLGVIVYVIHRLPSFLSTKQNSNKILEEIFKISENEVQFWNEKVSEFCNQNFQAQGILSKKSEFRGIFSRKLVKRNLIALGNFYTISITEEDFDERTYSFSFSEGVQFMQDTSIMPLRNIHGKVLKYETENKNCNDMITTISIPTTPLTMVMEMIKWITDIILEAHQEKLGPGSNEAQDEEINNLQGIFEKLVSDRGMRREDSLIMLGIDDYFNEVKISIFFNSVYRKLTKEKSNELCFTYDENLLVKCLFVFCIESVFYAKNLIYISFSEILGVFSCSAFDFFQFIPVFSNIPKIPSHFKLHLAQIETKILMHLGWKENSSIHMAIHELIVNSNSDPIEDNFNKHKGFFPEKYELFFEKMITETGCRIDTLCKSLKIDEELKENIWSTVKYIFSEKTEMIFGRHIAVIVLCSIYAVSKLVAPIKFKALIKEYWVIFEEEEGIFSSLKLRTGETVEILDFYNKEYIEIMRGFIYERIYPSTPRVAVLTPSHTLSEQITGACTQKKSPFSTPRTKSLLASPGSGANGSNYKAKALNFENPDPPKLPKIVEMMLSQSNEVILPMPTIKKS